MISCIIILNWIYYEKNEILCNWSWIQLIASSLSCVIQRWRVTIHIINHFLLLFHYRNVRPPPGKDFLFVILSFHVLRIGFALQIAREYNADDIPRFLPHLSTVSVFTYFSFERAKRFAHIIKFFPNRCSCFRLSFLYKSPLCLRFPYLYYIHF